MRDLKDLKKEEEEPGAKKVPKIAIVGLLGLLVFFALVLFFRGKGEEPHPNVAAVTPAPPPSQIAPPPAPKPIEPEGTPPPDPGVKPGEIHFSDKKEEVVPPAAPSSEPKLKEAKGSPAPSKKDDLTFFKTLKDKKENVALKPKKEMTAARPKSAPQAVKTSMKPAVLHPAASGHYAIQVASFSEKKGADTLAQKLKKKGFNSYVVAGEVPQKGRWYRVRVGSYPNRDEAKKAGDRIHSSEKLNFFVITD